MKLRILGIVRKLLILFAIVAGVFAFQGAITEALPKEKARIELVVQIEAERALEKFNAVDPQPFDYNLPLGKPQVSHPLLLTLLISSEHHHSSL